MLVLAADLQRIIGSGMPLVLLAFFVFVTYLRRRDRKAQAEQDRLYDERHGL